MPETWRKYTLPPGTTVTQWIHDFAERIKQLQNISTMVTKEQSKVLKVSINFVGGYSVLVNFRIFLDFTNLVGRIIHTRSLYNGHEAIRRSSERLVVGGTFFGSSRR